MASIYVLHIHSSDHDEMDCFGDPAKMLEAYNKEVCDFTGLAPIEDDNLLNRLVYDREVTETLRALDWSVTFLKRVVR